MNFKFEKHIKIVYIGCVQSSEILLHHLLSLSAPIDIVGIVTRKESPSNADFFSLEPFAESQNLPVFIFKNREDERRLESWLFEIAPDIIFCLGWPYLLSKKILSIAPKGVVGYHPTALPQNRGRHPVIWSLALGLKETVSTFFLMDENADSGDIIHQYKVEIKEEDNARTLYDKLIFVAKIQLGEIVHRIVQKTLEPISQNLQLGNIWRKRSKKDGAVDWRMSAKSIYNLIRALTRPYVGAHCIFKEEEVKLWNSEYVRCDLYNIEPGKILLIEGQNIIIKCGEGAIKLIEHDFTQFPSVGEYL